VLALIVCLTLAILLLGMELALVAKDSDQLTPTNSAALALAACVVYAAAAWRGAQEAGVKLFFLWWGTMLAAHVGLGLLLGLFRATLVAAPLDGIGLLQWAGGISLPLGVLQAGYAIGISAIAYGNEPAPAAVRPARPSAAPSPVEPPAPSPAPAPAGPPAPAARLQIYALALEKLRAQDHVSLLRFGAQAAKCEGGLLATREGQLVAVVGLAEGEAARLAEALPGLVDDLERLAEPPGRSTTMLHAAFRGYELLAVAGTALIGCLVGPQPGSREAAEAILPVLVARAEALPAAQAIADETGPERATIGGAS